MKTILFNLLFFVSYFSLSAQFQQMGSAIDGKKAQDNFGESISINDDGSIVAIGAPRNDSIGSNYGQVRIFKNTNNIWIQMGNDLYGKSENALFGNSISLSGNGLIVAIGSLGNKVNGVSKGSVYVYQFVNNDWALMDSAINGENNTDNFGFSVSLSQNGLKLAVGAPNNSGGASGAGQLKVYEFKNNKWMQLGSSIYGEDIGDYGGKAVSINSTGDVVAIGLPNNKGVVGGYGRGLVKVYSLVNNDWVLLGNGIAGEGNFDASGSSISLSSDGKTIIIGAPNNKAGGTYRGHTRIYNYSNSVWTQVGKNIDGDFDSDFSGSSVAISDNGEIVAIGASAYDANVPNSNRGQVKIFKNENDSWVLLGNNIDGVFNQEQFGKSVSLSSNGLIVGASAWKNSSVSLEAGQVRIYQYLMPQSSIHQNSLNKIKLWPNPTNEYLYIENINEVKQILIHNTLGIEVLNLNTFENGLNKIDLSFLNDGIYYMTIKYNNKIITEKINIIK